MSVETNSSRALRPSRDQVLADVKQIVAEELGITAEGIEESHKLVADLGCDSLTVIEILMESEEHFGITMPDGLEQRDFTVGDVVDGVLELLGQGERG